MNKTKLSSIKVYNNINTNERDIGYASIKYFTPIAHELVSKVPLLDSISSKADLPCRLSSIYLNPVTTYVCCDIFAKLKPSSEGMNRVSGDLLRS